MTLKELRIQKGLTQETCAKYLGMTIRNYQNYEKANVNVNTVKYNSIYDKLKNYSNNQKESNISTNEESFYTNVVTGFGIRALCNQVKAYKKRNCYEDLKKYIYGEYVGKVCVLYGLRRTGKTTLLFQIMQELPIEQVCYIKVKTTDTMSNLTKDLNRLSMLGYRYVFIDEITLLEDFINTAAVLSDIFSQMGMKIVLSGTDSLGFAMASRDELYDRSITIHTSFISFGEYARLLNICSIDKYIEYGGTLKIENMSFDDPDSIFDDVSFRDNESTRKYIDTAISRNIQRTLKNDTYGEYFNELRELYDKGELTNVINRIVENMNHDFLLSVINEKFKSHDFGSAKNLLLHETPKKTAYILDDVDIEAVIQRLKRIVEIKEKDETSVEITQIHINKVKTCLIMLDLLVNCPDIYENGTKADHYIFVQPGMRYAIAKALVFSLLQDEYFNMNSEFDKTHIVEKILEDVKGRMLEEIVLMETNKVITTDRSAFKFKFDKGGEYDMVVYNKLDNTCVLYEIKHSDKIVENQYRFLVDEEKCNLVAQRYGRIMDRIVLYRGKNATLDNGIKYVNVEQYLKELYKGQK